MTSISGSRTEFNLRLAFGTEVLESRRYEVFAARAEAEGNDRAAALFRAIAERRLDRARRHLDMLEPLDDTAPNRSHTAYNVRAAIMNALHESVDLYPGMARTAGEEGLDEIAAWFETRAKASRSQAGRFRRALEGLM
jgi:rubrerythrin